MMILTFSNIPAKHIGIQVPGPLHKICKFKTLKNYGIELFICPKEIRQFLKPGVLGFNFIEVYINATIWLVNLN